MADMSKRKKTTKKTVIEIVYKAMRTQEGPESVNQPRIMRLNVLIWLTYFHPF